MSTDKIIRVDDWEPGEQDAKVYYDGKLVIIPFNKLIENCPTTLNTFVIKRESYVKRLGNKKDGKGICHYINYFMKYYDIENELLMSYLHLKFIIDNKEKRVKPKAFIETLFGIMFTDSLKSKIERMVEDNYYVDISSKKGIKYAETLEFTVDHAKVMMKISVSMKLMVPIIFHYINTYNLAKELPLFNFYERLFYMFDETIDIYNKLWKTTEAKVKHSHSRNKRLWEQREILGVDQLTFMNSLLKEKIISENMFKYTFDKNIISFNSVIIDKQLGYFIMEKYDHTMVELSSKKDSEGLSGLDKLEMNTFKIDESLVILSDINIKNTIKKIRNSMNIELPKEEIQYYKEHHQINKFQVQLVNYYYAKYFGGYRDLNLLTRKQYLKLLVLLKRRLQFQGLIYLPQIITGNVEKLNKRVVQNSKFLAKIENSTIYQTLVEDKFSTLEELNKSNMIIGLLSTIMNSKFTLVDYDMPDRLGEPIEIANTDIVSDEFLSFLNQL